MGERASANPRRQAGDSSRLLEAAGAIADHRDVDWEAVESSAGGERGRGETRELRLIDAIARFHRDLQVEAAAAPLGTGHCLGDFEIVGELGRGGMGIVYEALQRSLGRRVALKVLPPGLALSGASVERFRREAHAAARLDHPSIVTIHATGECDGCHFYAMDLIKGPSLARVLDDVRAGRLQAVVGTPFAAPGAMPGSRAWCAIAARLVAEVAEGLEAAHAQVVIHRDVKPGNLLFTRDGRLRLADFGLARILEEPTVTGSGAFLGTPAYMSPEQVAGDRDRIDHRTDVYSLGAVLYESITLARPFPQEAREALAQAILTSDPAAPRRVQPSVPRELEAICLKAIEKDPARRYATAGAMAEDLRRFLRGEPVAARAAGRIRRLVRFSHRHPVAEVSVAAAVLVVAMGLVAWRSWRLQTAESARHASTEARLLFSDGDYRGTVEAADRAIALEPGLAEAHILRARAFVELAEPGRASAEAAALLAKDPEDWRAHLILAMLASSGVPSSARDLTTARLHLEAVARGAAETTDVQYLRALATPDADAAIALLDRALALDPAHGGALLERILRHSERIDFAACLADCGRLIVARPRSAVGHVWKGWIHLDQLHDVAAAEVEARRALAVDPGDAQAHALAGAVHQYRVQWEPALAEYARAMALQPGSAEHAVRRAELLRTMQRFDEALRDAATATWSDPWNLPARWVTFRTWVDRGNAAAARRSAAGLQALAPTTRDPRRRAVILAAAAEMSAELGDGAAALDLAAEAAALDPTNHLAWRARAIAWHGLGDPRQQAAACEAAARLSLPPREERGLAGWLLRDCGRVDLCAEVSSRLMQRVPRWPEAWRSLAGAQLAAGQFEEAVATHGKALDLAPRWAAGWRTLGELLGLILHRHREAVEAYDRSIALDPWQSGSQWPYFQRAWVRYCLGDPAGALVDAEESVRRGPGRASPAGMLLISALALGQCEKARTLEEAARRAVEPLSDPFFPRSAAQVNATNVPLFCPGLADFERALRFAERALAVADPPGPAERGTLGIVLYRLGRVREAESELAEGIGHGQPEEHSFLLYRAMARWRLGLAAGARGDYRRALALARRWEEDRRPDLVALGAEVEALMAERGGTR
jgi:tetratricopeptide (TPR) repeat protein